MASIKKDLVLSKSQQRTYDFMKRHKGITTLQANRELGETRLSARIYELKDKGVYILDEWVHAKNRYGESCLVKKYFIGRAK